MSIADGVDSKSSDGEIEASSSKALVGKDDFYIVLLSFAVVFDLLLPLLGSKKFKLVILQLLLQSLQLYFVLEYGLLIVVDLLSHGLYLLLLLL